MNKVTQIMNDLFEADTNTAEAGFDFSDVRSEDWKKLIKLIGASETPENQTKYYVWSGKGVTIYTSNDPITGKNSRGSDYREDTVDCVGYIGISGEKSQVKKVVDFLKRNADYERFSPKTRDFI